jgi:hypothetical protein
MIQRTALGILVGLLAPVSAFSASTINTTQPKDGVSYNAAPIRQNFGAAASDINGLLSMHAGNTAPSSPTVGELWLDTSTGTTYTLRIWNDRLHQWVATASLDSLNSLWITNVGGGLPVSLAAIDTTDLGSVPQAVISISGNGPIYSFGASAPAGIIKVLQFLGATNIVNNNTSLRLPGGADINTANGDMAIATTSGGGNWQVMFFQTADLMPAQGGTGRTSLTAHSVLIGEGTSPVNFAGPAALGYPLLSRGSSTDPSFAQLDLTIGVSGMLPVANGGTGLSSVGAHGLLLGAVTSPMTQLLPGTIGYPLVSRGPSIDPYYAVLGPAGGGTGTAGATLHAVILGEGTAPFAAAGPGATALPLVGQGASADPVFALLTVPGGGTGLSAVTAHYLPIGNGTSALTLLAPGTTGYPLLSQGAASNPTYGPLDLTVGVTGLLPVANGGTGATSFVPHALIVGSGTSPLTNLATGTAGQALLSGGAGSDPAYGLLNLASAVTGTLPNGLLPATISVTNLVAGSTVAGVTGTFSGDLSVLPGKIWMGDSSEARNLSGALSFGIDVAASSFGLVIYRTATLDRWWVGKDAVAETGVNAGSNFEIVRTSDAGAALGTPISITRSDGSIMFNEIPVTPGGLEKACIDAITKKLYVSSAGNC